MCDAAKLTDVFRGLNTMKLAEDVSYCCSTEVWMHIRKQLYFTISVEDAGRVTLGDTYIITRDLIRDIVHGKR